MKTGPKSKAERAKRWYWKVRCPHNAAVVYDLIGHLEPKFCPGCGEPAVAECVGAGNPRPLSSED